jgi:hypothetical protein
VEVRVGVLQRFTDVTPDRFAKLQLKAKDSGLILNSESGSTSEKGFTLNWKYDPGAKVLEIQCSKKPFVVPWSTVNKKIAEWVEG